MAAEPAKRLHFYVKRKQRQASPVNHTSMETSSRFSSTKREDLSQAVCPKRRPCLLEVATVILRRCSSVRGSSSRVYHLYILIIMRWVS